MKSKEIVKVKKATTSFLNLVKVRESQLDAYWKRTSKKIKELQLREKLKGFTVVTQLSTQGNKKEPLLIASLLIIQTVK